MACKKAILEFVNKVTANTRPTSCPHPSAPQFDNNGRLWSELPMYVELAFTMDRVKHSHRTIPIS